MAKLINDKYYTPLELAQYCIDKTHQIIGNKNITEYIEPSAGNGSFSLLLPDCIAFDIEPEHPSIIKQDFLMIDIPHKSGRCVIGNPPFGKNNLLYRRFCDKSFNIADYVAYILPISQYNNRNLIYKFDLIYSEKLNQVLFSSAKQVPVCFNIYKRPLSGIYNKRPKLYHKYIKFIYKTRHSNEIINDFDVIICAWGSNVGKPITDLNAPRWTSSMYIKFIDGLDTSIKSKLIESISNVDWKLKYSMPRNGSISYWHIYNYLNEIVKE